MSEENFTDIRFIRLRNGEDLVAYTIELPTSLVVRKPIGIEVETHLEMNRQIVTMYEWLSPSIAKYETITLNMDDVLLCLPVQQEFGERYETMIEILFDSENYEGRMKPKKESKKKKMSKEELQERSNNVVSLFEAVADLLDKKDKPVH